MQVCGTIKMEHTYMPENWLVIFWLKKIYWNIKWYQRELPLLKKQREVADYHEIAMNRDNAEMALKKSVSLINMLSKNFK